jgi:hypothetical protein
MIGGRWCWRDCRFEAGWALGSGQERWRLSWMRGLLGMVLLGYRLEIDPLASVMSEV